jgi:hypothetical protein
MTATPDEPRYNDIRTVPVVPDADVNYFGGCPICHGADHGFNLAKANWSVCTRHRLRWCFGSVIGDDDETIEAQAHAYFVDPGWGAYEVVEPYHSPVHNAGYTAPEDCPPDTWSTHYGDEWPVGRGDDVPPF